MTAPNIDAIQTLDRTGKLPGSALPSGIGTMAESFGASPSATAAINTASLNAALALGGTVTLNTPGVFQINAPLVYRSNTRLVPI
jgi:hypothetical protein